MSVDYAELIDAETWAFIRKTESFYPADATSLTIAEQRAAYDAMCAAFYSGRPEGIVVEDKDANGVPVRVYSAGQPGVTVLYCHGGSYMLGGLDSHDDVCAEICAGTGYRLVAVDYRLVPENSIQDAFDDCRSAFQWITEEFGDPVMLAGDSAGGCLVAMLAHQSRASKKKRILGMVLVYPDLGGDRKARSYREHADAPLLKTADIEQANCVFEPVGASRKSVERPLEDDDFSLLPPTVVFAAQCDPLASDAFAYCDAISSSKGRCEVFEEAGLVHGYLRARQISQRAANSFERIVLAVEALGQELWPYK